MRRGRSSLFLLLILIVVVGGAVLYLRLKKPASQAGPVEVATPTSLPTVSVVIAAQSIVQGAQITPEMLTTAEIPQTMWLATYFTDVNAVVGQYAKISLDPGMFLTTAMVSATPPVSLPGSRWATLIPKGMTAISVPVTRLSSAAYGIRDGDRVDVIATMLLVEVDSKYQSLLPNQTAAVSPSKGKQILMGGGTVEAPSGTLTTGTQITTLTAQTVTGSVLSPLGRVENEPALGVPFYVVPSEKQRPRLVSQMVIKNVQVLHVGTFPLTGEQEQTSAMTLPAPATEETPAAVTPTPMPSAGAAQPTERPDLVTLIVSPQDAVALTYFMYSGAQLTFTLRNPADDGQYDTEAATLAYLLAQYNIPVPVALPYTFEPRLDKLVQPVLPNDVVIVTP